MNIDINKLSDEEKKALLKDILISAETAEELEIFKNVVMDSINDLEEEQRQLVIETKTIYEIKDSYFNLDVRIVEVKNDIKHEWKNYFRVDVFLEGSPHKLAGWAEGEGGEYPLTAVGYTTALRTISEGIIRNVEMILDDPDCYEVG